MELRPGYKQTEVGVIPEEWEAKSLGSIAQLKNGYAFKSITYTPLGQFKVITIANVQYGHMDNSECNTVACIPSDVQVHQKLQRQDILVSMTGNVGRVCRVIEDDCLLNQRVGKVVATGVDDGLLFMILSQRSFITAMAGKAKGGAQGNLSVSDITEYQCAVPPTLSEQRAIAGALGDVDALLGALTKLIAKKRDLRQAAMQQLLTGETRLPGFQGEWEETAFRNVVRHHAGNSTLIKGKLPSSASAGLYPAYSASGQDVWCDHYEYEGDAVVVSAVGSRCGKAFAASGQWCAIANTHVVWPNVNRIDRRFLGFYINDEEFWLKSGSGQPFVLFKQTFARPLRLPRLEEQTAIAAVLSDMDAERAALEQRLAKTRAIKQGMMQELLTGRTRLV